jgi:hypothetical protein
MLKLDPVLLGKDRDSTQATPLYNTTSTPGSTPDSTPDVTLFSQKYWVRSAGYFRQLIETFGPDQILKNVSKPILLITCDPEDLESLKCLLDQNNVTSAVAGILIDDWAFANTDETGLFKFFPSLAYRFSWNFQNNYFPIDFQKRKFKLSCLNRVPKIHRALTAYYLSQKSWFDQVRFSFYGMNSNGVTNMPNESCEATFINLLGDAGKKWMESQQFPISIKDDQPWQTMDTPGLHDPYTPSYADTYANLCTESHMTHMVISEKSMKPIAAGNLLWMVSAPGHLLSLTKLGFNFRYSNDLYGSYDSIIDPMERLKWCINEVDSNYHLIPHIWHDNRAILQSNRNWLLSPDFLAHLRSYVQDLL